MDEALIKTIGSLPDDAPLWRYIRLSNLLSLFRGSVFIPSIETLQRVDPNEATNLCGNTQTYFQKLTDDEKALLLHSATRSEQNFIQTAAEVDRWETYSQIWVRELAQRRCAWCWYHGDIESMAQWHVYAPDGVAIKTTPRRIRKALGDRVKYGLIAEINYDQLDVSPLFLRPYFQKQKCYQHECEVRVILPRESPRGPGMKLDLDWTELTEHIEISPLLNLPEACELRAAVSEIANSHLSPRSGQVPFIQVNVSGARLRRPQRPAESFPDYRGGVGLGNQQMEYLFADDILREYPEVQHRYQ